MSGNPIADVTTILDFPVSVDAGETVTGTVIFRNMGPSTAEDVTYALELTPGLVDVTIGNLPPGATWAYDPATGIVTLSGMPGSVPSGTTVSGDGTTGIQVGYVQPGDAESRVASTIGTSTDQGANREPDSAVQTPGGGLVADVGVDLDFPAAADADSIVEGRVRFRNHGPSTASDVTYALTLSPGLEEVSFGNLPTGADGSYDPATGIVTFTGMPGTVSSGEIVSEAGSEGILLRYRQNPEASSEIEATIATSTPEGANINPNSASTTVTGRPIADVTTALDFPSLVVSGGRVEGVVLYRNAGPSTAEGVGYGVTLLPGLVDVEFENLPAGVVATYDPATGDVTFTGMPTTLPSGAIASGNGTSGIVLRYDQPELGDTTIESRIETTTFEGENLEPNLADALVESELADVTTSVDFPLSVNAGDEVIGRVIYRNAGPTIARGMTFALLLDPGLDGVAFENLPPGVTAVYDFGTGEVTFTGMPGTLDPDELLSGDGVQGIEVRWIQPGPAISRITSGIGTTTPQGDDLLPNEATQEIGGSLVADLHVRKGPEHPFVRAGDTLAFHIRVGNRGPSDLPAGALFRELPEGMTLTGATCTGAAGNLCTDAPDPALLVDGIPLPAIPVDGFWEIEVTARAVRTSGEVANEATVRVPDGVIDPDPENDRSRVTVPMAGAPSIGIAKEASGVVRTEEGSYLVDFALVVVNYGTETLDGVRVADPLSIRNGGSFGTLRRTGELGAGEYRVRSLSAEGLVVNPGFDGDDDPVAATGTLAEEGRAVVRLSVEFLPSGGGARLTNRATAEGTGEESGRNTFDRSTNGLDPDPTGGNDPGAHEEPTPVLLPQIGVAKELIEVSEVSPGVIAAHFAIHLVNLGEEPLRGVQVEDDLSAFGRFTTDPVPAPGEYRIESGPAIEASLFGAVLEAVPAGVFTGHGEGRHLLIAEGSSLPNGGSDASRGRIDFTLHFAPVGAGPFLNSAHATARSGTGIPTEDTSVDGRDPDPDREEPTPVEHDPARIGIAKSADSPVHLGEGRWSIPFRIVIENFSEDSSARNIQIRDDLSEAFPSARPGGIRVPGGVRVLECTGTAPAVNPSFDGVTDPDLLRGDGALPAGGSCTVTFVAEVDFGEGGTPSETQWNRARVTTSDVPGGAVTEEDWSQDGEDPDPDEDGDPRNNDDRTPIDFEDPVDEGNLVVTKSSPLLNVTVGQPVPYRIVVTNPGERIIRGIEVRDHLPAGFGYLRGSASIDGVPSDPEAEGRTLRWPEMEVAPGRSHEISLVLVVGSGAAPGDYVNLARAYRGRSERPISAEASATVRVVPDPIFQCSELIGKVWHDRNANGIQDEGEEGIAGVRIATARGWIVTTDEEGRYHIACAALPDEERGSNFVVKLDESSLPTGFRPVRGGTGVARMTEGRMSAIDFGVALPHAVRIEIGVSAFAAGGLGLTPEWEERLREIGTSLPPGWLEVEVIHLHGRGGGVEGGAARVVDRLRALWPQEVLERVTRFNERMSMTEGELPVDRINQEFE